MKLKHKFMAFAASTVALFAFACKTSPTLLLTKTTFVVAFGLSGASIVCGYYGIRFTMRALRSGWGLFRALTGLLDEALSDARKDQNEKELELNNEIKKIKILQQQIKETKRLTRTLEKQLKAEKEKAIIVEQEIAEAQKPKELPLSEALKNELNGLGTQIQGLQDRIMGREAAVENDVRLEKEREAKSKSNFSYTPLRNNGKNTIVIEHSTTSMTKKIVEQAKGKTGKNIK